MRKTSRQIGAMMLMSVLALSGETVHAEPAQTAFKGVIKASEPYGRASLSKFLFHVYDAQLWMDAESWSYDHPFALTMHYAMSFSANELVQSTLQEMGHLSALSADQKQAYAGYLSQAYRDIKKEEHIAAVFTPPDAVVFYVNDRQTIRIQDAVFAHLFFDIWLSEKTSEPALRKGLLRLPS